MILFQARNLVPSWGFQEFPSGNTSTSSRKLDTISFQLPEDIGWLALLMSFSPGNFQTGSQKFTIFLRLPLQWILPESWPERIALISRW